MYRIQVINRIEKELLIKFPDAKEQIIKELLIKFANEMFKNNCYELSETDMQPPDWMNTEDNEIKIEGFVMTPKEFKEAIKILRLIKFGSTGIIKNYTAYLYDLLTQSIFDKTENNE